MVVVTAERATTAAESAPTMASMDPGLKPYHPTLAVAARKLTPFEKTNF
jgi:hypothetical protein